MSPNTKIITFIASFVTIVSFLFYLVDRYSETPTNISGSWEMKFSILESSYKPYIGKSMTFKLFFTQKKGEIEAKGEKWWIDDKEIPFEQHDRMELKGTIIDGNKLSCTYTLHGNRRETIGNIEGEISDNAKSILGTFYGTVADSKGPVWGMKK